MDELKRTNEIDRREMVKKILRILKRNRGKVVPLEKIRRQIFGKVSSPWVEFRQKLMISHAIRKIRDISRVYVHSIVVNGVRGYKVLEKPEEFEQVIGRYKTLARTMEERSFELSRAVENLEEYLERVNRFYNGEFDKKILESCRVVRRKGR